jgi:hypothetical protein
MLIDAFIALPVSMHEDKNVSSHVHLIFKLPMINVLMIIHNLEEYIKPMH